MLPRATTRRTATRMPASLVAVLVTTLVAGLFAALPSAPAYAANPVTPGTFKGLGFDQCDAPSQAAMSAWIKSSPFRAAGIYISGNSRACRTQTNLTPTWVRNQLAAGWHLMPITLGPQASCSTRYPRYGKNIDPTINPSSTNIYSAARAQGRAEAKKAVSTAKSPRHRPRAARSSTTSRPSPPARAPRAPPRPSGSSPPGRPSCTPSATRPASTPAPPPASGCSTTRGSRANNPLHAARPDLDRRLERQGQHAAPPTSAATGGSPTRRAKQYRGGHNETWGGVTINIDRNYLNLRTPKIGGGRPAPRPAPAPAAPKYTGTSTKDARCTPASISRSRYRKTAARTQRRPDRAAAVPAQAAAPLQVRGHRHLEQADARRRCTSPRRRAGYTMRPYVSRNMWTALLTKGNSRTALRTGVKGADVVRVQRALNAALGSGTQGERHLRRRHPPGRGGLPALGRDQGLRHRRPGHLGGLRATARR